MENNLEIWHIFIELVKNEFLFMTKYKDYKFIIDECSDTIDCNGRVTSDNNKLIKYSLIILDKDEKQIEKLVLHSIVKK
jgi:hypothetical protein